MSVVTVLLPLVSDRDDQGADEPAAQLEFADDRDTPAIGLS